MRSVSVLLCVGSVALAAAWTHPKVQVVTRTVTINLNCSATGATVSVNPWRVSLATRTDQVQWNFTSNGVDSAWVSPKFVARWPFTVNPPLRPRVNRPAVASGIPATVPAGRYQYNITGVCNRAGGVSDTIVIDPDMIIPPIGVAPGPGE